MSPFDNQILKLEISGILLSVFLIVAQFILNSLMILALFSGEYKFAFIEALLLIFIIAVNCTLIAYEVVGVLRSISFIIHFTKQNLK